MPRQPTGNDTESLYERVYFGPERWGDSKYGHYTHAQWTQDVDLAFGELRRLQKENTRMKSVLEFSLTQESRTRWPCPGCGRKQGEPLRVLAAHDDIEGKQLGTWVGCFYCNSAVRIFRRAHEALKSTKETES